MITVYSKADCSYCEAAKNFLNQRGIPFTEIKIGVDIVREEVVEMFPNHKTVPIIVEDGGVIGGYQQLVEYVNVRGRGEDDGQLILG